MITISAANEPEVIGQTLNDLGIATQQMPLSVMPYADYMWVAFDGHTVGVERKATSDLLGSMFSRLEVQLTGCLESFDEVVLLIEGLLGMDECGAITSDRFIPEWLSVEKYCIIPAFKSRIQKLGIDYINTCGLVDTAYTLKALYNNSQKKEHKFLKRYIRSKPVLVRPDVLLSALLGLVRNGEVSMSVAAAGGLLRKFGSVSGILNASVGEMMEVRNVGKATAVGLLELVSRRYDVN